MTNKINTVQPEQPDPSAKTPSGKTPSGAKWPVMIVGLLLLNVGVCAATVTLSLRNPAAVEPDYYTRGMNWDETRKDTATDSGTNADMTADASSDTTDDRADSHTMASPD